MAGLRGLERGRAADARRVGGGLRSGFSTSLLRYSVGVEHPKSLSALLCFLLRSCEPCFKRRNRRANRESRRMNERPRYKNFILRVW
jgi:hypothetical protein